MSYYLQSPSYESLHVTLPINTTAETRTSADAPPLVCGLHNHLPIEIITVTRGELHVPLDGADHLLRAGETVLVNPFVLHSCTWEQGCTDGEYLMLTVTLTGVFSYPKSILAECASSVSEARFRFDERYPVGHPIAERVKTIHRLYHDKSPANEALCLAYVYSLLGYLLQHHYHPTGETRSYKRDVGFLKGVTAFISKHYAEEITTADVAAALFMQPSQFCRIFRRHFGVAFSNHLCKYRIERAVELYHSADMPLSEIAKAVGFGDYCYFSRSFKRYTGDTPAHFFGKWKKTNGRSEP